MTERDGTLAIDIDLGRFTAWSTLDGVVADSANALPIAAMLTHRTVLVETVSPFFYAAKGTPLSKGEVVNRLKWAIFNAASSADAYRAKPTALFSPSSDWTLKYPEDVREMMAGCFKKHNHDVRACICMIYFHGTNPKQWVSWPDHINSLLKD